MLSSYYLGLSRNYVTREGGEGRSQLGFSQKKWYIFLQSKLCSALYLEILIILQCAAMKIHSREFLFVWDSFATRSKELRFNHFTNITFELSMSMCKGSHRSKLQLVFFTSFDILRPPYMSKAYHSLVNDTGRRGEESVSRKKWVYMWGEVEFF